MNPSTDHDPRFTMPTKRVQRRQVVIDKKLQNRLILRIGGLAAFYFLASLGVVTAFPILYSALFESGEKALAQARFRVEVVLTVVLLPMLVTFVCFWVHGIRETLRVAGPIHRFRRAFADLRHLRFPATIQLRDRDYLHEVAKDLNDVSKRWRLEIGKAQIEQTRLAAALARARSSQSADDWEAANQACSSLSNALHRFQVDAVTAVPGSEPANETQPVVESI